MRPTLLLLFLAIACGGASPDFESARQMTEAKVASEAPSGATAGAPQPIARKEIVEGDARVRVDDIGPFKTALTAELARLGGRLDGEDLERSAGAVSFAHLELRVPADQWDALLGFLEQSGELSSVHVRRTDVTEAWVDLDARTTNLRAAEARLQGLLRDHAGDLKDVLAVEQELTRVRGEIEASAGRLRAMDGQIAMSRLSLTVDVTETWTPAVVPGFPEEAGRVLDESTRALALTARGLALLAVGLTPWLLVMGVMVTPFALWLRRRVRA